MATLRDHPYSRFNFLVDLGSGNPTSPQAGFAQVTGLMQEVTVIEYRNGNSKENSVHKQPGLNRCGNVTLKRGIIGSTDLYDWINQIRGGAANAQRTVVIQLLSEDQTTVVQTWKLLRAIMIRHVTGPLDARVDEVAIEEAVIAFERLEIA